MNKLKPFEDAFIKEYIDCGYIGQRAYLKLRPYVKPKTAQVEASKLLSKPIVRGEIERLSQKGRGISLASREKLIQETHAAMKEARQEKAYGVVIKGIELKGKLNRLFERETSDDTTGYQTLIQQLTMTIVNPSGSEKEELEVIDIEKEDKE